MKYTINEKMEFSLLLAPPEQLQRLQGDNNNKKGHFLGDSYLLPHALGLRIDEVPRKTLIATQRKEALYE
jgi:hypothetical protein